VRLRCAFCALGLFLAFAARADLVVVVAPDSPVTSLSQNEAGAIFLKIRSDTLQGVAVTPYDSSDEALRNRFYQACCNKNALQVKAYWSRLVFSGRARPPATLPPEAVAATLVSQPAALLYLDARALTPQMKVVARIAEPEIAHAP
jgi:hypothetical protein